MCDTLGFFAQGRAYFGKNSDRSPNEPQVAEFYPAQTYPAPCTLRVSNIELPQARETHGLLLSRPVWLWGGEMGVNDCGVCIGNEAVFTKGPYSKTGLLGMDLLRLGLERGGSAREALETVISLLERYGQGGNCGYDHAFYYDNSFLIMDRNSLYVLETAGREWTYKTYPRASISNRLSIGADGDAYSGGLAKDFAKTYTDPLYTAFSGSAARQGSTACALDAAADLPGIFRALRTHADGVKNPLGEGSVKSPCMHAGKLVGDHTTASMAVELGERVTVWLTGCSTPCISLYKPYEFGSRPAPPVFAPGDADGRAYWLNREAFHREALSRELPGEYFAERNALEAEWLELAARTSGPEMRTLSLCAAAQEAAFYDKWRAQLPRRRRTPLGFRRYWLVKNRKLEREQRETR